MIIIPRSVRPQALAMIEQGTPSIGAKDSRGRNVMHYCAEFSSSQLDIAAAIIKKKKGLVKEKDKQHVTPLHLAVISGNKGLCELLLKNKADVNGVDCEQHNVIHMATANGHAELIQFLADSGAKLNRPDKLKNFSLHYAVQLCGGSIGGGGAADKKASKDKGKKAGKDKKKRDSKGDVGASGSGSPLEVSQRVDVQ